MEVSKMKRLLTTSAVLCLATVSFEAVAGWTNLSIRPGLQPYVSSARVCKTTISSQYGPLYRVNYQVFRKSTRTTGILVWSYRVPSDGQPMHLQSNYQWLYGVVAGTGGRVYTSPFAEDYYGFQVRFDPGTVWDSDLRQYVTRAMIRTLRPSQIANC